MNRSPISPALHQAARLLDHRIHADVEIDRVDLSFAAASFTSSPEFAGIHRQRFLTDHMLAGQQGGFGIGVVQ